MFSSLARGRANWHGGIQLDQRDDDLVSLPSHIFKVFTQHDIKSTLDRKTSIKNFLLTHYDISLFKECLLLTSKEDF